MDVHLPQPGVRPERDDVITESATPKDNEAAKKREADEPTLTVLRKQFRTWLKATDYHRGEAIDDAKFRAGTWNGKSTQWVGDIQKVREAKGRPCLTINRIPGSIRQVTNAQRAADLRIRVNPVGDKADPKIAETLQGIIRNIENDSFADRAYVTAGDKQAEGGLGYFRLLTEYVDDDSFKKRIRIKRERDSLAIGIDPAHDLPSATDAKWAFKYTDLDRSEFKDIAGDDAPDESAIEAFGSEHDQGKDEWFPNGRIRLMEWFNTESKGPRKRIAELTDGTVIDYPTAEQLLEMKKLNAELVAAGKEPVAIKRDRWVQPKKMVWRKCTALKIYEETEWPVLEQPFIQVIGEELTIDGVRDWRGIVRDSKEPARVYNAEVTALVESVGLGTKAPVVGYRGQFGKPGDPLRAAWEKAGIEPVPFLEVEPLDIDGKPAPIPQKVTFEPPLQGIVLAIRQTDEDYKTTSGFHDASLGERGPQESGVAIDARKKQDELGGAHYIDNLRFALVAGGRQLIKLIRVVYDVAQVIRITGDGDQHKRVMVYSGAAQDPRQPKFLKTHDGPQPLSMKDGTVIQPGGKIPFELPEGVSGLYDLSSGDYDIEVSAGHNAGTRRQEAMQVLMEIFKGMPPEFLAKFLDLFFNVLDFPTSHQFVDRAKKLLPPELQDEDGGGQPIPPQLASRITQMQQQFEQLKAAYTEAQQKLDTKAVEGNRDVQIAQMNNASKEKIAEMKVQADAILASIEHRGDRVMTAMEAVLARMQSQQDHRHAIEQKVVDAQLAPPPIATPPAAPGDAGAGA